MKSTKPNILFLFSDQHAQRIAGCYGDAIALTPNLDQLATAGVTFDNAYCPSPLCVPSRMAMLTARHPYSQECWTNDDYLRSDQATWLHAAGAAGYRPSIAGRLHSMGPDQLHGYADRVSGDHSPNWPGVPRHDLGVLNKANDPWRQSLTQSGRGRSAYQVKDEDTAAAACATLDGIAQKRLQGDTEPFCLTVGFLLPHPPYVAAPEDFDRFADAVPALVNPGPVPGEHRWLTWWRESRGIADVSAEDVRRARVAYYGLVYRMDALIGQVLDTLARHRLDENTLIVYSSDHGDHLGERGLWWKHTMCEESVRVPLIVSWPGRLPQGQRRRHVVSLIDVAATFVDAMEAAPLPLGQGKSLLPVAQDEHAPWSDETYSEYCSDSIPAWTGGEAVQQRMVRSGIWKLVYVEGHAPQLFNLEDDPGELRDLSADEAHQDKLREMLGKVLNGWDPVRIARVIQERRLEKEVIGAWARNTHPPDQFRFQLDSKLNQLEQQPTRIPS
jgi:choline-sulfatase